MRRYDMKISFDMDNAALKEIFSFASFAMFRGSGFLAKEGNHMKATLTFPIAFVVLLLVSVVAAQNLPSNPLAGREVVEQQGCLNCHAVNGTGGAIGPDFAKRIFFGNDYDLLSKMWNHSQQMLLVMSRTKTERPHFTGRDFKELSSFLNFIRYLGRPGNASTGKRLFTSKNCIECHSVGVTIRGKIPLDSMKIYVSPVKLAQEMWNHSISMHSRGSMKEIKFPTFGDNEFADLTEYIRAESSLKTEEKIYSYPGDPIVGQQLFKEKGCYFCHIENHVGPKLDKANTNMSVTEIAGIMWNHSAKMSETMKQVKRPFPLFTGNQMADVISYLYFQNTPSTTGSADLGARLFKDDGCISCHVAGNHLKAPTVEEFGPFHDKNEFLAALWNHASRMEELLVAQGKQLPKLLPNEIKSLYLFINAKAKGER